MSDHDFDLDPESLELVLQLQLHDLQFLLRGKYREGEAPDSELALETYKLELETSACCISDRKMCRSMAQAVELDEHIISALAEAELQATHDRYQALNLDSPDAVQIKSAPEEAMLDDEFLSRLKTLNGEDEAPPTIAESSGMASKRQYTSTTKIPSQSQYRNCLACSASVLFLELARCPCKHEYCRECIIELFSASTRDESLFPPRCCKQPIPLPSVQELLYPKLVEEFQAKELEYGTPNRMYCHRSICSAFVPPQSIEGDTATCVQCQSRTCVKCKDESHDEDCSENLITKEFLATAAENGWQQCISCHRMVELITGCNHISKRRLP
ncbi:hypothetical protein AK830_g4263 [Neonectria ditissima]|uniref:RBR-type E3 ubiquitin transferase n=1 Tax=Neonectria ditissima TaxID=78410 RepID=A0A0P7BND0_9HYPO|nr:hypothetical protein AK830_g4263 [Neonectria ditissima]